MTARKTILLKIFIIAFSLGGVLLSLFSAQKDGYSHWARRLLYFTAQSNLWIGFINLFILFSIFAPYNERREKRLYIIRYIFTVSITLTGIVFCGLLAPFASDYGFRTWALPSVFTHAVVPALAVIDFFLDRQFFIENTHVALCILPPAVYFFLSFVLEFFYVDFGRGVPYPYFFMNFRSPVGVFGFSATPPFIMGTFYWFLLFPSLLYAIAFLYKKLYNR